MKLIKNINKISVALIATGAFLFQACTPDSDDLSLGNKAEASFIVTDISTSEMKNTFVVESTTDGAFLYKWDLGNGQVITSQTPKDTISYEDIGVYTITLTAVSAGGQTMTSQQVETTVDAIAGTSAVQGGDMENAEAWNLTSTGGTMTSYEFSDGAINFTNSNPAQSNVVMWQEVELKGGRNYQFDAKISIASGMENSWVEVLLLTDEPVEGEDPSGNIKIGLNTWTGCGVDPASDLLTELSCRGDGKFSIAESGTYYLVIKVGSWDGFLGNGGVSIDDVSFTAGVKFQPGDNILVGSDMEDPDAWTVTNIGLPLTKVEFEEGKLKFTNGNAPTQSNVGVWQEVEITAGQAYQLQANYDSKSVPEGSWLEFYLSDTKPANGADYTTGQIYTGDIKSFDTGGTYYMLIKCGSWDNFIGNGILVDDVELVEMN